VNVLQDVVLIYRRQMRQVLRNPLWVVVGLIQPALYLGLFGPLLIHLVGMPGFPAGSAWQIYTPGLLVQLCIFGSSFVGFAVIADWRAGVIERMRVTPVLRAAPLLGRVLRDVTVTTIQSLVLTGTAFVLGLRAPAAGLAVGYGFVVATVVTIASLSYTLALLTKSEDSFAQVVNLVTVLLLLLSGVLLPMTLAPHWLDDVSALTPLRYVVQAMRDAFAGQLDTTAVIDAGVLAAVLAIASVTLGARVFTRENA
jgi:ABC-2 type transport system permease protein